MRRNVQLRQQAMKLVAILLLWWCALPQDFAMSVAPARNGRSFSILPRQWHSAKSAPSATTRRAGQGSSVDAPQPSSTTTTTSSSAAAAVVAEQQQATVALVDAKLSVAMRWYTFWSHIYSNLRTRKQNRTGSRKNQPRWMRHPAFLSLTSWAFDACDHDKNGKVYREDLYAGVLLVHLHLAKYLGAAATNPLNRTQVEEIFEQIDVEDRGWVDLSAFQDIVLLSTVHIGGRIVVYYAMLVALAPFLTARSVQVVRFCGRQLGSFAIIERHRLAAWLWAATEWMVGHIVSVLVFAVVVPWTYAHIEQASVTSVADQLPIRTKRKEDAKRRNWWRAIR